MSNKVTGRLVNILPPKNIVTKSGKEYTKQEIYLDAVRYNPETGEQEFSTLLSFTFFADSAKLLEGYNLNDIISVYFSLSGFTTVDEQTKETKVFTQIRPYKIELVKKADSIPQPITGQYGNTTDTKPDTPSPIPYQPEELKESEIPF